MLLEDLNTIAQLGAKRPLILWQSEFLEAGKKILPQLQEVSGKVEAGTEARLKIEDLIKSMQDSVPNEKSLADNLVYMANVFGANLPEEHKSLINSYIQAAMQYRQNAGIVQTYKEKRDNLRQSLSPDEQKDHDLKLFQTAGMLYVLEYYLAIYKTIQDAEDEAKKSQFFVNETIDLGLGDLLGLWVDFSRDEVLGKFVLDILNDEVRNKILEQYYITKEAILGIERTCDEAGVCVAAYRAVSLDMAIAALKALILILIDAFQTIGIERLSSYSFQPYGNKPALEEVKKLL